MKTLDEVIAYFDNQTQQRHVYLTEDAEDIYNDALQYLKEFKRISARLEKIALGNITETLEKLDNPPLTWEELKTMEGKPVWVEDGLENGEWYIIECFTESGRFIAHDRYADDTVFKAIDMGNMWQAYRKERS